MNLNHLTPEQVRRQLREAAGWESENLRPRFGLFYQQMWEFLRELRVFVEEKNAAPSQQNLQRANRALEDAYRIVKDGEWAREFPKVIEAIGKEIDATRRG